MKTSLLLVSLLSLAAFAAGCQRDAETRTAAAATDRDNPVRTADKQIEQAHATNQGMVREMNDYGFDQRAAYTAHMQVQVDELERNIDAIAARIDTASDAVKAEAQPRLVALRSQLDALENQVNATKDGTVGNWATVKNETQKAFTAVQDGYAAARQWVNDRMRS